jgi:8-oxo-dGTP pyrophosphatase MutT (NUDIX family)
MARLAPQGRASPWGGVVCLLNGWGFPYPAGRMTVSRVTTPARACYEVRMPIPDFIVELRRHIGHAPLWLPSVTAVVIRGNQVLLVRRPDNGAWSAVTGIVEPGENPADCAVREVLEQTGVRAISKRLAWVHVTSPTIDANGDQAQYLDHVFRMDWVAGNTFVPAADERLSASFYDISPMLPALSVEMRRRVRYATDWDRTAVTFFDSADPYTS